IHVEPHGKILRILDLVLCYEPRSERAECLAALALRPLSGALELKHAFGHVIAEAISGNEIERLVLGHVARTLPDHDAELHLPIELARSLRDHRIVVGSANA